MRDHDLALPVVEDDRALVLAPWSVLREQAGPVLPVLLDNDGASWVTAVHPTTRTDEPDLGLDIVRNPWLRCVTRDAQREVARHARDAAVAQVEAEQRGIRVRGRLLDLSIAHRAVGATSQLLAGCSQIQPVPHRGPADAQRATGLRTGLPHRRAAPRLPRRAVSEYVTSSIASGADSELDLVPRVGLEPTLHRCLRPSFSASWNTGAGRSPRGT